MENLMVVYSVAQVSEILGISRSRSYELFNQEDFPSFYFGKLHRITKEAFNNWINNQM